METKGSLEHSKQPADCPYPETDRSIDLVHPFPWRSILTLSYLRHNICSKSKSLKKVDQVMIFIFSVTGYKLD